MNLLRTVGIVWLVVAAATLSPLGRAVHGVDSLSTSSRAVHGSETAPLASGVSQEEPGAAGQTPASPASPDSVPLELVRPSIDVWDGGSARVATSQSVGLWPAVRGWVPSPAPCVVSVSGRFVHPDDRALPTSDRIWLLCRYPHAPPVAG